MLWQSLEAVEGGPLPWGMDMAAGGATRPRQVEPDGSRRPQQIAATGGAKKQDAQHTSHKAAWMFPASGKHRCRASLATV
jgi:hypothetical protein